MSRKKKSRKRPGGTKTAVRAWRAWLAGEDAEAPAGDAGSASAIQTFLSGDGDPPAEATGDLAEALVQHLAEAEDAPRLQRCTTRGSKALAKAARRALHGLRRKGVEVPEADPAPRRAVPMVSRDDDDDRRAVMTTPFGDGDRVMVFRFRGTGDRRLHAGVATVNDERGLRELDLYLGNAKLYQAMARQAAERVPAVPVPFAYALHTLSAGAARNRADGRLVPETWGALRGLISLPTAVPLHPCADLSPAGLPDAEGQYALWQQPALRAWSPGQDWLAALGEQFQWVLESAILVTDNQREVQLGRALDEALDQLFADGGRERWAGRLQDAAWIAEGQRAPDVAGQLLALRQELLDSERPAALPFWRQLVIRLFQSRLAPNLARALAPGLPAPPSAILDAPAPDDAPVLWTPGQGPDPTRGGGGQGGAPPTGGGLIVPGR